MREVYAEFQTILLRENRGVKRFPVCGRYPGKYLLPVE